MSANSAYQKLIADLEKAGIAEQGYQWYSFLLGLLAKGFEPGSRAANKAFSEIFNDALPLPGAVIAFLTTAGIEAKEAFDEETEDLLKFPDSTEDAAVRLSALSDLAYAVSIGLSMDEEKGRLTDISDPALFDELNTLSEISKVDSSADLMEDDLNEVIAYIKNTLLRNYKMHL
ncbi:MAG TPA: hypothetical protein DCR21_04430 [Succinivibrionaceae bacterium]|jgi:uncharacterized protein YgfB (UPF0149 family)|nr:hypothetical protein [Succinivibrionaceae bacterium]